MEENYSWIYLLIFLIIPLARIVPRLLRRAGLKENISARPESPRGNFFQESPPADNFRESSIYSVIDKLKLNGVDILVYEPLLNRSQSQEFEVVNDLQVFKNRSDIIIANRSSSDLNDVNDKLFSRDIFNTDL